MHLDSILSHNKNLICLNYQNCVVRVRERPDIEEWPDYDPQIIFMSFGSPFSAFLEEVACASITGQN